MPGASRNAFIAAVAAALVALTVLVELEASAGVDNALRELALGSGLGTFPFWRNVSFLGSTALLTSASSVLIVALVVAHRNRSALQLAALMIGALLLNTGLKRLLRRERPPELYPDTMPTSFSFPSGHALMSLVFYFTISFVASRMVAQRGLKIAFWIVASATVGAIGLSRVYLGVHYPSDVVAGYLVGALWLAVAFGIISGMQNRQS
jgi:undecaprenyl-diphosphatase